VTIGTVFLLEDRLLRFEEAVDIIVERVWEVFGSVVWKCLEVFGRRVVWKCLGVFGSAV
jgi:hypothetical protein